MSETRFASIDWEIVWGLRLVVSGFLLLAVVVVGSVGGGSLVSMYALGCCIVRPWVPH